MKIETLKEFEAMLKVCRKHGVTSVAIDGIALKLEEAPAMSYKTPKNDDKMSYKTPKDSIDTPDALSDEDVMFWSVNG